MKKLNVLFINESSLPKTYREDIITGREMKIIASLKNVNKIFAICRGGTDYIYPSAKGRIIKKIEVIHLPFLKNNKLGPLYYLFSFFTALNVILKNKIDIVHGESPLWSGPVAISISKIFGIPCTIEVRATYEEILKYYYKLLPNNLKLKLIDFIKEFSYRLSDHIIVNSEFHELECLDRGMPVEKISEINPGVKFNEKEIKKWRKNKSRIATIGFIGRLTKDKGVDYFLKAIHYIVYQKHFKNFKAMIVGNGPEKENFERLTETLNIKKYVKFIGYVEKNYEWISKFDLLVNPTLGREALSMVNVDAYVCKIPAIGFGENGLPETIIDGKTGFIVKRKNYKILGEKILSLIKNSYLRKKLGKDGYEYMKERYSFDKQVKKMQNLYFHLSKAKI